jgi:hypothetical protein
MRRRIRYLRTWAVLEINRSEEIMHANEELTDSDAALTHWEMNAFWATSALCGSFPDARRRVRDPQDSWPVLDLPLVFGSSWDSWR